MTSKPDPILFLDDHRGIYIPRDFAEIIRPECLTGVEADTLEILMKGPDDELYWEAWQDVLDHAVVTEAPGTARAQVFSVYQDGACWLIPDGMEWSDDEEWFVWPTNPSECVCQENNCGHNPCLSHDE